MGRRSHGQQFAGGEVSARRAGRRRARESTDGIDDPEDELLLFVSRAARAEAARIIAEAKAEIQADLARALAEADADISARAAESERRIAEIRASAMQSVAEVARDTAAELVAVLGGSADAAALEAAVGARMKGQPS